MRSALTSIALSAAIMVGVSAPSFAAAATPGVVTPTVAVPNGTAGVPLTVTVIAPDLAGQTVGLSASLDSVVVSLPDATLDSRGRGAVPWTPPYAGRWTVASSNGNVAIQPGTAVVAAMPTTTEVILPNRAARFEPMSIIAEVRTGEVPRVFGQAAVEQSLQVEGTVTFYEVYRGRIGSVRVKALPGDAVAALSWTPPQYGDYAFYAEFEPSTSPAGGPVATTASRSDIPHLTVQERRAVVALRMPELVYVDEPVVVSAVIPDLFTGAVGFSVDDRPISSDREVVDGYAATEWTPLEPGVHTVTVELRSERFPRLERRIDQQINVLPSPVGDPISVSPVIGGVAQRPWQDGQVLNWPGGQRIPLVMSSGSGAPVNLSQSGACLIQGTTLVTPVTGGGCIVTFSTVGAGGFGPNTATVLISSEV